MKHGNPYRKPFQAWKKSASVRLTGEDVGKLMDGPAIHDAVLSVVKDSDEED